MPFSTILRSQIRMNRVRLCISFSFKDCEKLAKYSANLIGIGWEAGPGMKGNRVLISWRSRRQN